MTRVSVFFCSLFFATGVIIAPAWCYANVSNSLTIHVSLLRFNSPETDPNPEPEVRAGRHRSNQRPLYGSISADGVSIPGVETSDILSFEIYTPEGFCMGAFAEEPEFIQTLFSLSGEYEIRLITEEAVYIGFVEL
ncbi:MAG: hypothetical protein HDS03_05825 [Bacteroides sp.]|nr:hypothetical protein [Bacteroides sp.]